MNNITNTGWAKFTLPNWQATNNHTNLVIRAFNNTPDVPGNAFTISWGRIDNICIRDVTPPCTADFNFTGDPCTGKFNFNGFATGTAPITYAWNFGDPGSGANNTSTLQNPMHQFSGPGTYTVTLVITDATGCTASYSAQVTVTAIPSVSATSNKSMYCLGETTTLTATPGSGTGYTFSWGPPINGNLNPISFTHTSPGTYTVVVTATQNGCTATNSVTYTVNPAPQANAGPDQNICQWQLGTLMASGGGTYLWNPGNSTQNPYTTPPVQNTTTYTVQVTGSNGCTATDQVTVSVKVCDCETNPIVQNGKFETTTAGPCSVGDEDIQNAVNWNGIWPTNNYSTGDLFGPGCIPGGATNSNGNFAGFWVKPHCQQVWREGIMNTLSIPINPNSGNYEVSMNVACIYGTAGTARLHVYGVPTGSTTSVLPVGTNVLTGSYANCPGGAPLLNTNLFIGPPGGIYLGQVLLSSSNCSNNFSPIVPFTFNSNILNSPVNRIYLTRDDGTGGTTFALVDDVCIKPILDTTSCQCGALKKATIQQKWTQAQNLICDGPFITVPCKNPGADYLIKGDFTCNPHGCGNSAVSWVLTRPAGLPNITGSSSAAAYPHFQISLLAAYFTVAGNYTLTLSRNCGTQACSCKLNFKIDPCPCLCDSTFNQEVALGYSVSSVYLPPSQCRKRFRPIALCPTDMVTWIVPGIGTFNTVGNAPQTVTFPSSGKYKICMLVKRTDQNGNLCTGEFCRDVEVKCGIGPADPVTSFCTDVKVKNGGFNQGVVSGYLTETGLLDDWEIAANPGEGRVFVEDTAVGGSLDEGYVVLHGGMDNFAGIMQAVNLVPDSFTIINFEVNNLFGENQPAGTTLEVRLQDYPYTHDNLKKQVLLSQMIGDSGGWHRVEHSVSIAIDSSLHYLVICLQSADSARASIVGLDNFEFCTSKVSDISGLGKKKKVVRIFPNPNFGSFTVELPQAAGAGTQFRVIDLAGRLVSEQSAQTGTARQTVEAGALPAGLYFLQVVSEGKILATEKFVKQ
ncbi:MAG: T9SS type A sorting domain-containing protein [Saprospirales bacterium]|nr:T9SS type A sorting domain-containing protein [Saprospirales bacterium]